MVLIKNQGYAQIYCVGDSLEKDIAPGNAAGVSTVWIPSRWELPKNEQEYKVKPTYRISKLKDIIRIFETLSEA